MAQERPDVANHTVLTGVVAEPVVIRATPAGRAIAHITLTHDIRVQGLAPLERLALQLTVLAMGSLAEQCRGLPPGTPLRVTGQLNQKRWVRDGKTRWGQVELVARAIDRLEALHDPADTMTLD